MPLSDNNDLVDPEAVRRRYVAGLKTGPQAFIDLQAQAFESAKVNYLVQRFGLRHDIGKIYDAHYNLTGSRKLSLAAFNDVFSTFPFILASSTLRAISVPWGKAGQPKQTPADYAVHRDDHATEPARFKNFRWVPFVAAFEAFNNSLPAGDGRIPGLIFPRRGINHGMFIHSDHSEQYWKSGLCWVYKVADSDKRLYVQPFTAVIEAVFANGRGWRPS